MNQLKVIVTMNKNKSKILPTYLIL
jgi:hypothetical protein